MKTARAKPSRGTCSRCSSRPCPSSAWSFTRSRLKPSSALSTTRASLIRRLSTRKRRGESSTASTATKSAPCCGARSGRVSVRAACSRLQPDSSSTASASGSRSSGLATGTSTPRSPPPPATLPSPRGSHASMARRWRVAATSPTAVCLKGLTPSRSTSRSRPRSPRRCETRPSRLRSRASSRSRTRVDPRRRSRRRPCNKRPDASCGSLLVRRCRWPSRSTKTATSPICAPTRPRFRSRRWMRRARRRSRSMAPIASPRPRASTRASRRTRKRRTRPCDPRATCSARRASSRARCAATTGSCTT